MSAWKKDEKRRGFLWHNGALLDIPPDRRTEGGGEMGMSKDDLISRAAAIDNLMTNMGWRDEAGYKVITDLFNGIPAVDAAPVVHGRWIGYPECLGYDGAYHDEHIVCSECHLVWNIIDNDTERFDYCPACGAKMKEGE